MSDPTQSEVENPRGAAAAFRVFAILWAWTHLLELLIWPVWLLAPWGWLVFFASAAVLFRPDSVRRFARSAPVRWGKSRWLPLGLGFAGRLADRLHGGMLQLRSSLDRNHLDNIDIAPPLGDGG